MRKKTVLIVIAIILIVLVASIFIIQNRTSNHEQALKTIKVNEVTRSVFYAPQYVAISNGYFKEQGLEIELSTGQGADSVMTSVLSNQCEIGFARTRGLYLCI